MASMVLSSSFSSSLPSSLRVKCTSISPSLPIGGREEQGKERMRGSFSRRIALPLSLTLFLSAPSPALAVDVPLFGIRKRVEQAEKEIVKDVQELVKESEQLVKEGEQLVKEGEKEVGSIAGAVSAFATPASSGEGVPPLYQAAAVAGAELLALAVASSVVNGVVRES